MSYFEIGICGCKTSENIGTLLRSAYQLGASGIFVIGRRYEKQHSNTYVTERHIPLREYSCFEEFKKARPYGSILVGVEMGGVPLETFNHPKQAIYILGAEDNGLPKEVLREVNFLVSLSAIRQLSYNVAVTGSIVMYHRMFFKKGSV